MNALFDESKPVRMLVRDGNGNFETATSKLTIDEEFEKSLRCPIMDTNNNNHDTNNNNAPQLVTGDDVSMFDRSSIKSFYRNACILVTGGTGFVGKKQRTVWNEQNTRLSIPTISQARFCWKNCSGRVTICNAFMCCCVRNVAAAVKKDTMSSFRIR